MKVLVLGSTGYLGSALTATLTAAGHEVVPLVRGDSPARPTATETRIGDLAAPATLRAAVTPDIDAVVHAAAPLGDWERERTAVQTMLGALGNREKRFVYLSGTWVLGPSSVALDERSPARPIPLVAGRETLEALVTGSRVTGIVLRPGIVHGRGGGIPAMLSTWAGELGRGRFVGREPAATWPTVHVDDLARLVEIALTGGLPGDVLHGIAQFGVPVADIARAADVAAGGTGRAEPWDEADAGTVLGPAFAEALATSQVVTAARAAELGWVPEQPDIVTDLVSGSYALPRPA